MLSKILAKPIESMVSVVIMEYTNFAVMKGFIMKVKGIIIGQKVKPAKQERAKQLRQTMTPEEKILWSYLRNNKLNELHFRKQQVVDGFIVDFYCHSAGVVVEVDGGIHEQQKEYDAERDRIISSRGIRVIRIRNEEIRHDIYRAIQKILQVCESGNQFGSGGYFIRLFGGEG